MTVNSTTKQLVGLGVATTVGHLLYPAALYVASEVHRRWLTSAVEPRHPAREGTAPWPPLTVLIAAYREVGTIADKLDDVRANGYQGEIELLVVSEDHETAEAAEAAGARVIEPTTRLGKSQALNVGLEAATHEIVVLTDANNKLVPGSLAAITDHFDDPAVGAVAGAKTEEGDAEALYWRFESWQKARESTLGTTIGIVGELFAVRKSLWRPIPMGIGSDDLWTALDFCERGHAVRFEPKAKTVEPSTDGADQWERRVRISAMALVVVTRKRELLDPRRGLVAFELIGHKVWRATVGPIAHIAMLLLAFRTWRSNRLSALVLAVHVVGAATVGLRHRGTKLPGPLTALGQVLYLQLVALGGMVRFLRGRADTAWQKPAR